MSLAIVAGCHRAPRGAYEYELVHALPAPLETSPPTIEQIERELEEPLPASPKPTKKTATRSRRGK